MIKLFPAFNYKDFIYPLVAFVYFISKTNFMQSPSPKDFY